MSALLIALDIDGTVLLEDESFSPGVREAVAHARAAGHEVMLATGRSWDTAEVFLQGLGLAPEFVVCSNGAVLMRRGEDGEYERFEVRTFDASSVLQLLGAHFPDGNYMVELADGTRLFTHDNPEWQGSDGERVEFEKLSHEPVSRVVVIAPGKSDEHFLETITQIGLDGVTYAVGWSAWLDIAPHGVDKATALTRVCEILGTPMEDVIVMGDGRNDIGMLSWARGGGGRAIAMGQSPDEVRSEAGEVTETVYEGGVARVLNAL